MKRNGRRGVIPPSDNSVETAISKLWASQEQSGLRIPRPDPESWPKSSTLYRRDRDLPRLIQISPDEIVSDKMALCKTALVRLEHALIAEWRRCVANHWSYDSVRHLCLLRAVRAEWSRLATSALETGYRRDPSGI